MAHSIRAHYRKRRMQRWLRREALLLAREAAQFDCETACYEAQRLIDIVEGRAGMIYELKTA